MKNLLQRCNLTAAAAALLLLVLFGAQACGIKPNSDGSGQTAVVLDLRRAEGQSALTAVSDPSPLAGSTLYVGLLEITGPGLGAPLHFLFPDLSLGSVETIWVPSGSARTFELWIYEIPSTRALPNTFPATLLVTLTPPELRTVDLTGEDVSLVLTLGEDPNLAEVGTYNGDGYIEMDRKGTPAPVPGTCGLMMNATLVDPAFNGLELGPFLVNVGLNPTYLDGEYLITNVPAGRFYKLKIGNPWMGWSGESPSTLVGSTANPNPIDVVLAGFQPLTVGRPNSYVGDGLLGDTVDLQPAGGFGSYNISSYFQTELGRAAINSGTGIYSVIGLLGQDSVDDVVVADRCAINDRVPAKVFWYMVPILLDSATFPAVSPTSGTAFGGDWVWLSGEGFDANTQVFFGDTVAASTTFISYNQLQVVTPPWPVQGPADIRLFNPRSNALFPGFTGFDFIYPRGFFFYTGFGCPPFCAKPLP